MTSSRMPESSGQCAHLAFGPRGSTLSGRQNRLYEMSGSTLPLFVFTIVTTLLDARSTVTSVVALLEASALVNSARIALPQACFVSYASTGSVVTLVLLPITLCCHNTHAHSADAEVADAHSDTTSN